MSTRLERAERLAEKKKIHPTKHREIIIAERNKEIRGLQKGLREAQEKIRLLEKEVQRLRGDFDYL